MPRQKAKPLGHDDRDRRRLPFDDRVWGDVIRTLDLAPQQARIVERLMRGFQDKEITADLGIAKSTPRTYMSRMFTRFGTRDRVALVLHVVQAADASSNGDACHQK